MNSKQPVAILNQNNVVFNFFVEHTPNVDVKVLVTKSSLDKNAKEEVIYQCDHLRDDPIATLRDVANNLCDSLKAAEQLEFNTSYQLYSCKNGFCIDSINARGQSNFSGREFCVIREICPSLMLLSFDELTSVIRQKEQAQASKPTLSVEITEQDYDYSLGCMPPELYVVNKDSESFQLAERRDMNVAIYFVKNGNRYFKFDGPTGLSHKERLDRTNRSVRKDSIIQPKAYT